MWFVEDDLSWFLLLWYEVDVETVGYVYMCIMYILNSGLEIRGKHGSKTAYRARGSTIR